MSTDTKRKPTEKIGEPSKRWRNWYLAKINMVFMDGTGRVQAGEIWPGSGVWPSKEVAEAKANEHEEGMPPPEVCEYLGAEPEPDAQ